MIGRVICLGAWGLFAGWAVTEFVRGAVAQHRREQRRAVRSVPPAGPSDRFGRRP